MPIDCFSFFSGNDLDGAQLDKRIEKCFASRFESEMVVPEIEGCLLAIPFKFNILEIFDTHEVRIPLCIYVVNTKVCVGMEPLTTWSTDGTGLR